MNSEDVLILLGPPGAGKGTQASLLSEKLDLYYFETSKILEKSFKELEAEDFIEVAGQKYYVKDEDEKWKKGILCDPPFVSYLVKKELKKLAKRGEGVILAGSPRTFYEAKEIMPLLKSLYDKEKIKIVLIEISFEESLARNSKRRICELMRHPILYNQETKNLTKCPLDGSRLIRREGLDDPDVIKVRWKEYQERTLPIIDYLETNNFNLKKIDGEGSVSDVYKIILKTS
jgi:adenylate kinase